MQLRIPLNSGDMQPKDAKVTIRGRGELLLKYNLIERRLFPHITRACQGMLFDTLDTVVTFMRKASTSTGLRTTVNVMRRHDETGRKATAQLKQNPRIVFDNLLPKWNYRAIPQDATVIN
jgi:hypothetical protein